MPAWVIVFAVLLGALALGALANHWVRPFAKSEVQGVKLELLISPLVTLTVLLLAFVLVQVFASYRASKDASGLEAGRVVFEYDLAGYYEDPIAQPMQSALICYARAVAHQDWPALAGDPELSPAAGRWGAALDTSFAKLRVIDNGQPYGTLLSADKERTDGRRLRLVQARPTMPVELQLLLLGTSALAVLGIAAFTLPYVSRRTQIGALVVLTTVLGVVLLSIVDLDTKYEGFIQMDNADFLLTDQLLTPRYEARFPAQALPCDAVGLPI